MRRRRFAAIVNPISGRRPMTGAVRRLRTIIEGQGGSLDVHVTQRAAQAIELAATLGDSIEGLLIVGGDGTVNEVLQGLAGRSIPFVILRTGTENLLARELNMPTDIEDLAATLMQGDARPIDVATANGRRLAAVAGVGFDAECVERMERIRRGHITRWSYFWPIWHTFWGHRFPRLRVEIDGARVFDDRGLVILGVIGRYARNLRILRDARWDDGLLDVAVFPCDSRWDLAVHALRVLLRRHVGRGGVI